MSIASEITRIQGAKADLKSAIEAKGVTVGNGLIDTYAAKVAQISGGSSGSYNAYTVENGDEMYEIEDSKPGDICVIVENTRGPMTSDTYNDVRKIHIEPIIELPNAIISNIPESLDCNFYTWDEDPSYYLEFYYSDNMASVNVDTPDGHYYFDYYPTSDYKQWIIGGFEGPDGDFVEPVDIVFDKEVSLASGSDWDDFAGYFMQVGEPNYYSTSIAGPVNEQLYFDDGITEGVRYLVFPDAIVSVNTISDSTTGKLVANDGSQSLEVSLSASAFSAVWKNSSNTVLKTITYTSNNGEIYSMTSDNYGVIDFGADPNKWMIWDENAGMFNYDLSSFLRSIDQRLIWKEIPVDGGAEPVS